MVPWAALWGQQMSAIVTVANRQRRLPLDLKSYKETYASLCAGVLDNLKESAPDHLEPELVDDIAEKGTFSVAFVSKKQIQKLNQEWMGKDYVTDVLSFPLDLEPPPSPEIPWEIGEIIISVERAEEQAKELGHSFEREMAFLFVHGMLHVLGFDHMEPAEERDMFGRQKQILDRLGITR